MDVDEVLARAEERRAELEQEKLEKEQALYTGWVEDAQRAWNEGRDFYQPIIPAYSFGSKGTPRGLEAETALQAIVAAGWRLHTWAVAGHSSSVGTIVFAHPLFIRGE